MSAGLGSSGRRRVAGRERARIAGRRIPAGVQVLAGIRVLTLALLTPDAARAPATNFGLRECPFPHVPDFVEIPKHRADALGRCTEIESGHGLLEAWERGEAKPTLKKLEEFAKATGLDTQSLRLVRDEDDCGRHSDISYFAVAERTYTKRDAAVEIAFMKWLLPEKAKFTPKEAA